MPLLVSPNTAALQSAPSASAGNASQQQDDAGNFGKMLTRSLNSQDQATDKATAVTTSGARPDATSAARRPAANDDKPQDDPNLPALAFMPLPPAAVNPLISKAEASGDSQGASAAEKQLNAAIAAAGGKTAMQSAAAEPAAESAAKTPAAATPVPAAPETLVAANVANVANTASASARDATASKESSVNAITALTHDAALQLKQTVTGDSSGQQAPGEDSQAGKHAKTEKTGKQGDRGNIEFTSHHADNATITAASANELAGAKTGIAGSSAGPMATDIPGQFNLSAAGSHAVANTSASNAASPEAPKLALTPAVGSDDWAPALGKQMVWLGKSGSQTAELHLNPPQLGPLKLTLTLNDNQAQAMFVSAHQSVRSALEAALPQLRNSLAESGINLGNTSVSADTQQQQQQQQSAFAQNQDGRQGSSSHFQHGIGAAETMPPAERGASVATPGRNSNGKVDIFA